MQLEISDPKNLLDNQFIRWLIVKIRNKVIIDINLKKLENWNKFFNTQSMYKSIYKKKIIAADLIIAGVNNLDYLKSESNFIIRINPNIYAPGLDRLKLSMLCKLINFGNADLPGYPIFTSTFDYFAENIQEYVNRYLHGIL